MLLRKRVHFNVLFREGLLPSAVFFKPSICRVAFKRLINTAVNNRVLGEPKYKHSKDKYMKHP